MKIHIETGRFYLRDFVAEDAEGMFALDSNPNVHRYLGNNPVQSIEQCVSVIKNLQQQYADYGIGRWAVIEKSTGIFVGWSGLKYELNTRTNTRYYDIGYRLREEFWGKGIATETARATLDYGFLKMNLDAIHAAAHIDNIGSNKILQKIGMTCTEQFYYEDMLCNWYELKKSVWEAKDQ